MTGTVLIVGAGLSGASLARVLAEAGFVVQVVETRAHIGGNCHTERDDETGILVHHHGPHIFHTDCEETWRFVTRFCRMRPYHHRVRASVKGRIFSLPINLHTLNQVFENDMRPPEARAFIEKLQSKEAERCFETAALSKVGHQLYRLFFEGYTYKQWGVSPTEIPAKIFSRLPIRFTFEDAYFLHRFQAMPDQGYTQMIGAMLDHPAISVQLNHNFHSAQHHGAAHVFYTGPLDAFFNRDLGALPYRSLRFEHDRGFDSFQGCAVMNYPDVDVPYTRITEHKYFAPWETHKQTIYTREFSFLAGPNDLPYYPLRLIQETPILAQYVSRAEALSGVSFLGRLATYRYLDMDQAISEARALGRAFIDAREQGTKPPVFSKAPL